MTDDPGAVGVVSAQVVLQPADHTVDVDEPITSDNLTRHLPDPAEAAAVRGAFSARGFALGPLVGIGFAITASPSTFQAAFGEGVDGVLLAARRGDRSGLALDIAALPAEIARAVRAVELTAPPDFGPGAP